jgi:hypothetical protein
MQSDPVREWRRLTEHYRHLGDLELRELGNDFADLTEVAQQVLRDEMRKRGLPIPHPSNSFSSDIGSTKHAVHLMAQGTEASKEDTDLDDGPRECTWKTELCECEEREQVWQLQEMLHRAGIDSWNESEGLLYPRILVAADQLEEARLVIAKPVPQEIIDDSRETIPVYEIPRCPTCRAADPVLEEADPTNTWRCVACGRRWSDPALIT